MQYPIMREHRDLRFRALIAGDQAIMRKSLNNVSAALPCIGVVGVLKDGAEALKPRHNTTIGCHTFGIQMPKMSGLEVLRQMPGTERGSFLRQNHRIRPFLGLTEDNVIKMKEATGCS
jgi:DNA-binding NarL/FixJ family response regulator